MKEINFTRFIKEFNENYDFMYNHPGYWNESMLTDIGDSIISDERYKGFMQRLILERKDFISSDREAAALAVTMLTNGGLHDYE